MLKAAFLDRDGVINAMVYDAEHGLLDSPASIGQIALLPGAAAAIARLNRLGLLAVIVSNQPGVAKGRFTREALDGMNARILELLKEGGALIGGVYCCMHHPDTFPGGDAAYQTACSCRKPQPGLLQIAARDMNISLAGSYMLGDGITDIQAGFAAGCKTALISSCKCDMCQKLQTLGVWPDCIAKDLGEAADWIEERERTL